MHQYSVLDGMAAETKSLRGTSVGSGCPLLSVVSRWRLLDSAC